MIVPVLIFLVLVFVAASMLIRLGWRATRDPATSSAARNTIGGFAIVIGTPIVLCVLWFTFVFVVFAFGGVKPPMY